VSTFAVAFAPATAAAVAVVVVLGCDRAEPEIGGRESAPREAEVVLAPGYGPLGFPVPEPGSYTLPPLGDAGDGRLLASDGSAVALHDLLAEKVTILSLMYASCSDVNGCPLATFVLKGVQDAVRAAPDLTSAVRLISFSFDPEHDIAGTGFRHRHGRERELEFAGGGNRRLNLQGVRRNRVVHLFSPGSKGWNIHAAGWRNQASGV